MLGRDRTDRDRRATAVPRRIAMPGAVPSPTPRRPSAVGMLLIGAAAGYALATWMDRHGVTWRELPSRLLPPPRPQPAAGTAPGDAAAAGPPGRLALARDAARRAMTERRRALEAEAGRALGAPADRAAPERRNGAGGGEPVV